MGALGALSGGLAEFILVTARGVVFAAVVTANGGGTTADVTTGAAEVSTASGAGAGAICGIPSVDCWVRYLAMEL